MKNLVSIIVPCYNQAQFLDECLQSVFQQTYINWECIIVNDGSLDNTENIAQEWLRKDNRFKYIYKENGGLSSARNAGLDLAVGDYIQFLDSDDYLDSSKLAQMMIYDLRENNRNIIICNFKMFNNDIKNLSVPFCNLNSELLTYKNVLFNWEKRFSIPIHCGLFSNFFFKDFRFPEELQAKEDWIMWICLFQKKPIITFINENLVFYRKNEYSMTRNHVLMSESNQKAIWFLRKIIPENDYVDFLVIELQNKFEETHNLKKTIINFQNSATYKVANKLKNTLISKFFFRYIN